MTTKNETLVLTKSETSAIEMVSKLEKISNSEEMSTATEYLSRLNQTLDRVVEFKEKKTKPLNALLKVIRAETKPFEEQLENSIATIRKAMTSYQTEMKRIEKEKEDRIADRVGDGKGKLKIETAGKKISEIERVDTKVESDSGSVKFKTVKKFEVEDISKLPVEFLLPNETAIREAMKNGQELAGVRYFTEEVPINSR